MECCAKDGECMGSSHAQNFVLCSGGEYKIIYLFKKSYFLSVQVFVLLTFYTADAFFEKGQK